MERKPQEETLTNSKGTPKVAKKPYAPPRLTEYGNVSKLTQGGGSAGGDAGAMAPKPCL